jgi:hypothetical protein
MKLKYFIIVFIVIIGVGLFMVFRKKDYLKLKDLEKSDITYFSMFYTQGYMINSDIRYKIEYSEETGKYMVLIKPYGVSEEDGLIIEEDGLREKIKDILVKYQVNKWHGFNKSDHDVLDGDSFSIYVKLSNDKTIEASGYMSWPDNYRNVRDEISEIFMEIYNKKDL